MSSFPNKKKQSTAIVPLQTSSEKMLINYTNTLLTNVTSTDVRNYSCVFFGASNSDIYTSPHDDFDFLLQVPGQ